MCKCLIYIENIGKKSDFFNIFDIFENIAIFSIFSNPKLH